MAIDDIRSGAGTDVVFDYHADYTSRPVAYVRENWWVGPQTNGRATFGELRVQRGATLTVDSLAALTVYGPLTVSRSM